MQPTGGGAGRGGPPEADTGEGDTQTHHQLPEGQAGQVPQPEPWLQN